MKPMKTYIAVFSLSSSAAPLRSLIPRSPRRPGESIGGPRRGRLRRRFGRDGIMDRQGVSGGLVNTEIFLRSAPRVRISS